jgi:hypothetical protein
MMGAARGAQMHASTGQANRDFLPDGLELRAVALPAEPKPWVPLSRGECLLLALMLRRTASEQRGEAVDAERRGRELGPASVPLGCSRLACSGQDSAFCS